MSETERRRIVYQALAWACGTTALGCAHSTDWALWLCAMRHYERLAGPKYSVLVEEFVPIN